MKIERLAYVDKADLVVYAVDGRPVVGLWEKYNALADRCEKAERRVELLRRVAYLFLFIPGAQEQVEQTDAWKAAKEEGAIE